MNDTEFMRQPVPLSTTATRLTDWKVEPALLTLKGDLEQAKPAHDEHVRRVDAWNNLLQVKGSAAPQKAKNRSSVQPKLIRRQAEWRYSALTEPFLGSNKLFSVSPVTWEDKKAAVQNEMVLNWQFRTKLNKVSFIDNYVRATVDEGSCVVRLGWNRVTKNVQEDAPVFSHYPITSQEQVQQLQQALQLEQQDPHGYSNLDPAIRAAVDYFKQSGQPTVAQQTGTQKVTTEKVMENHPTVEVMNLNNVYIDPACQGDLSKAYYAIVSFETSKAELLKNPQRYKNLDLVDWEGNLPVTNPDYATSTPTDYRINDTLRKRVVAYEYWGYFDIDGDGSLTPIVATWIGSTMIRLEKNPFPDQKLPFVVIPYLPIKRELYGEPDAELLEDNQKILGAVTRGMIDLLGRSANGQQGFAKGMLDPLNRRRYDEGRDYEFNPNLTPAAGLIEHRYPELPQSALLMLNLQNQDAEALTGVKSFSGGMSGEAYGNTATGIRGVLDAASKREMAILRRLAQGMSEIGQKIVSMNGAFLSEQEVVRVTNDRFEMVKREDLQGAFDLSVDISTAEVDNAKSQDLAFMLQTLGPKTDWNMTAVVLAEICRLKRMPDLAHQITNFQPQPDPIQQQMAQLELALKQKQLAVLDSEIALNQAKAAEASSKKDKADLDYVEQETGTAHAREMQKMKAQSQGNQNLEVTKALITPAKPGETKPNIAAAVGFNELSDRLSNHGLPEHQVKQPVSAPQQLQSFNQPQLNMPPVVPGGAQATASF